MEFWKHFKPKGCTLRLKSRTKDEALEEILENLVQAELMPRELAAPALRTLLERERLASTGVGMNVAIPHVKVPGLEQTACSLSIHVEGLEWQAVDAAPVHILFTILRPERASELHDPEQHLELMRWIARLGRDADFRRFATRVKTKTELVQLLKEKSTV
jgi:mannitol/fructose-specific phosphotransferase system IIA component (Ntr-type)